MRTSFKIVFQQDQECEDNDADKQNKLADTEDAVIQFKPQSSLLQVLLPPPVLLHPRLGLAPSANTQTKVVPFYAKTQWLRSFSQIDLSKNLPFFSPLRPIRSKCSAFFFSDQISQIDLILLLSGRL